MLTHENVFVSLALVSSLSSSSLCAAMIESMSSVQAVAHPSESISGFQQQTGSAVWWCGEEISVIGTIIWPSSPRPALFFGSLKEHLGCLSRSPVLLWLSLFPRRATLLLSLSLSVFNGCLMFVTGGAIALTAWRRLSERAATRSITWINWKLQMKIVFGEFKNTSSSIMSDDL